jgi:transcriptional regulator with XRE-family HTH domain
MKLTDLRIQRRMNKAELARKAEIDQSRLSKFESGREMPYPTELLRLAAALGLPESEADSLVEYRGHAPTRPPVEMTLRNYFAGQVIAGGLVHPPRERPCPDGGPTPEEAFAREVCDMADAMIAEIRRRQ